MKIVDVKNLNVDINSEHKKDVLIILSEFINVLYNYEIEFDCQKINIAIVNKIKETCNAEIKGGFFYSLQNKYITFYAEQKNLSYNLFHQLGHLIEQLVLTKDQVENIYQSYLQKSDVFDVPNDYSIVFEQCIPQLIAHYYLNQLNEQSKHFVQEMILK